MLLVLAGTGRCPASEVCIVSASSFSSLSAHQPETAAVSRSGSLALNRATRLPSSSPPQAQLSALHPLFSLYHLQLAFILSLRVLFPSLQCRLLLPPTVDQRRSGHRSGCAALLCVRLIFSSPPLAAMAGGFEGRSSATTTRGVEQVRSRSACAFLILPEHCGNSSRSTRKTWASSLRAPMSLLFFSCLFRFHLCISLNEGDVLPLLRVSFSVGKPVATLHFVQNKACQLDSMMRVISYECLI